MIDEETWISIVEGWSDYSSTINLEEVSFEKENTRFEYYEYKILDINGDERFFDYIKNSDTNAIGVLRFSELYTPDTIASAYPDEDPFDIKAISELLRGYGLYSVDILNVNNQTPNRYLETDCIKIDGNYLRYFEVKISRIDRGLFDIAFSDEIFKNQEDSWDCGQGDVDSDEYQFKGNDFSLKSFPSSGFADGGEGDIELNDYQFTDDSFADFRGTNG